MFAPLMSSKSSPSIGTEFCPPPKEKKMPVPTSARPAIAMNPKILFLARFSFLSARVCLLAMVNYYPKKVVEDHLSHY